LKPPLVSTIYLRCGGPHALTEEMKCRTSSTRVSRP
jgi:hypothetical protein